MADKIYYRPDIDGLRAVAVLGVILYHFGADWLPGGFAGVDVFFVISGYLITSVIRRELEMGTFSFAGFWMRRIRRIMPALLVMIVVSLGLGWLILMPGDLNSLGYQGVAAAFGASNFYFWRTSGYFDQVSELVPLLHTWSLGVEEQFYLVWPLVLLAGWTLGKHRDRPMLAVVAVVAIASFSLSLYLTGTRPEAAFYLAPARGWELALGAALTYAPPPSNRLLALLLSAIGGAILGYAFMTISADMPFPGWAALLPCGAAAMLIHGGMLPHRLTGILSAPPVVAIGKLSYSLYLWHWPVWVFYRHYNNSNDPDLPSAIVLAGIVFALAYLSWRFVEEPFRRHQSQSRTLRTVGGLAAIVLVSLAGIGASGGGQWRIPDRLRGMDSLERMWEWQCPRVLSLPDVYADLGSVCEFGADWNDAAQKVILWGDSHAEHMAPLLQALVGERNVSVRLLRLCAAAISRQVQYTRADIPGYTENCDATRALAVGYLNANSDVDTVVLAGYWTPLAEVLHAPGKPAGNHDEGVRLLAEGLKSVIIETALPERAFFVVMDVPRFWGTAPSTCNDPESLLLRRGCQSEGQGASRESHLAEKADLLRAFQQLTGLGATVIDTGAGLCQSGTCQTVLNGEFIYRDVNHIRRNLKEATRIELARLLGLDPILAGEVEAR